MGRLISWGAFQVLRHGVMRDPKGQLDFFHTALFAVFDPNRNNVLDAKALDDFLDIFYKEGSIFIRDCRLPEKDFLRACVYSQLNSNKDGLLTFSDIKPMLTGNWVCPVDEQVPYTSFLQSTCSGVRYEVLEVYEF